MSHPSQSYSRNLLLNAASADDFAALQPHLERVELDKERRLVEAGRAIEHVYFPERGVASIVTFDAHSERTEVALCGREGMSGTALLLGSDRSPHETFIQVPGGTALRIEREPFLLVVEENTSLRLLLLRYVESLNIQMAQTAASNAVNGLETRLARWLLMSHDRVDGDEIALTHEFISMMLAVRRSGVTVALQLLEGKGVIQSRRALIHVVDRERLESLAGNAYGSAEDEYRRLIGPFGKRSDGNGSAANVVAIN